MPRAKIIPQSDFPYHVGARNINRDWFAVPMPVVWQMMSEHLHFVHHAFELQIQAFVLMTNHFHLLCRTPQANLPEAMTWFMRETSRELTRLAGRINQSYGGRHHRSVINNQLYFSHAYKYVYANPLKAGLADSAIDYPYSTLRGLLGYDHLTIPLDEDHTLFDDPDSTLRWLDRPADEESWDAVGRALHRKEFKLAKVDRKSHPLENDML